MRSALIVSALAALALGAPRPQDIDFDTVDATPDPEVYVAPEVPVTDVVPPQPAAEITELVSGSITTTETPEKRDLLNVIETLGRRTQGDCHALPVANGEAVNNPDTADAFLAYAPFRTASKNAAKPENVPVGYTLAFSNLNASMRLPDNNRLGTYSAYSTYDVPSCVARCSARDDCQAINIYYERDPTLSAGDNCPDPASQTSIICVLWGVKVTAATAINPVGYRRNFKVVQAGSNGYNKNVGPAPVPGFSGPVALAGAINAPLDPVTGQNTYMTQKFYSFADVQSYANGVQACTKACTDQTAYNARHPPKTGVPARCNFVVTFLLSDSDSLPQGVYCALYTEEWSSAYATNYGQYRANGNFWSNTQVYAYTNATYDASYEPICAKDGCPSGSYGGGSCGGYGPNTCGATK